MRHKFFSDQLRTMLKFFTLTQNSLLSILHNCSTSCGEYARSLQHWGLPSSQASSSRALRESQRNIVWYHCNEIARGQTRATNLFHIFMVFFSSSAPFGAISVLRSSCARNLLYTYNIYYIALYAPNTTEIMCCFSF